MLHRISSAALAVIIAAIFAAAPIGAGRADAQAEHAATSAARAGTRDDAVHDSVNLLSASSHQRQTEKRGNVGADIGENT